MKNIKNRLTITPVCSYQVGLECWNCGKEMKYTGLMQPTAPPMYVHECESCGESDTQFKHYPHVVHEPKETQP